MAYIGRVPQVGNYFTLDAITTSSTATYNLLKGGVAYVPETAYHLFVSLNGVIQAPITAYTVSGSTITFASSLSGTDSIDFITVLGDTLAIGTPSDGTVTDAKIVDVAATKLTGSIADARVPASAVTQHVTGYDDSAIRADISALALREATNEASAAFNLPNSFIDTFATDVLGTKTNIVASSGYISTYQAGSAPFTSDGNTLLLIQSFNKANANTTFTDESSNTFGMSTGGDTQHSTSQSLTGTTSSIKFDGTGDQLFNTGGSSGTTFQNINSGDFTIEFWFYKKSGVDYNSDSIFDIGQKIQMEFNSSEVPVIYNYPAFSNWAGVYNNSYVPPDDTWTHLAYVRQGNTHRAYLAGVQRDNSEGTGTGNADDNYVRIGYHRSDSGRYFDGFIDAIRISNNVRYADGTTFTPPAYTAATTNATGTAIQAANTVGSAKTQVSGTMLYKDNSGTATLGTDLKIYFTCNGGTNWTEAASYNAITPVYATGIKQVRLGKTTCTSGTDIRYKAVWANQASGSKETQLHGIGINY